MKKMILALAVAAMSATVLTSSNNAPKADDSKTPAVPSEMKIAYVESDTIVNQYQFAKEFTAILEKKSNNIQATLQAKQQALEAAAANFQQKIQQNAYTREQAESVQAGLQKQSNDLQALQQRLGNEFQEEQMKYQQALQDSIDHFLAQYNKDKKYSFILTKGGVYSNVLYADKSCDITADVVAGLNKTYKPAKTESKKSEVKK